MFIILTNNQVFTFLTRKDLTVSERLKLKLKLHVLVLLYTVFKPLSKERNGIMFEYLLTDTIVLNYSINNPSCYRQC